jgi:zinc and cadmium transporter
VTAWVATLVSVGAVSLVALVGLATLAVDAKRVRRIATALVSFAVGALLGDAFIHLIPETFAHPAAPTLEPSLRILGGMLLFFVAEKLLRRRQRSGEELRPLATINIIGDAIHNFIDGMLVAASYLVNPALGVSTTIAVLFHEIPQELGDFGVLVHSGLGVRKAVLLNLASASAAILGAVATLLAGMTLGTAVSEVLVPVTAGGFVYIAAADLIPELQRDRTARGLVTQGGLIAAGVGVMVLLTLVDR